MKNLTLFLVIVALIVTFAPVAQSASMSTAGPGVPMDTADSPMKDFVIPATQTYDLNGTATLVGTVPSACHTLYILASGPVNVGNASVTHGLNGGVQISTGGYLKLALRQDDSTPAIYVINQTSGSTATVRLMYAK
jgi:hypothetical protein